jgi:O-methyltransferase involved in polyketide biosynthesis
MYLLEDAVGDTLGWIAANAAPTSTILFDYTYDAMIQMAKAWRTSISTAFRDESGRRCPNISCL